MRKIEHLQDHFLFQAHTLYNAAAARRNTQDGWKETAFKVQQAYWKDSVKAPYSEQEAITKSLKTELLELRNEQRKQLERIHKQVSEIKLLSHRSRDDNKWMTDFVSTVRVLSENCTEKLVAFAARVIENSLQLVGEKVPCEFTAVAIGSLARGEATSYSDLEYLFLIEKKPPQTELFFEQLAMTTYFIIGNLSETKLRYMGIKELEGWFDDTSQNGFKIDGLACGAGNIPTGNDMDKPKNYFICTPQELGSRYKEILDNPSDESIRGALTAMLKFTVSIYSTGSDLLPELRSLITSLSPSLARVEANKQMLLHDFQKFDFAPSVKLHHEQAYTIDVKRQIYRFPSILLLDLATVHNVDGKTACDTAMKLIEQGKISTQFHQSLVFQLACACYIRFSAYLYHDSHDDRVSVAERIHDIQTLPDSAPATRQGARWHLHAGLLTHLFGHMVSMKDGITKSSNTDDFERACLKFKDVTGRELLMSCIKSLYFSGRYAQTLNMLRENFPHLLPKADQDQLTYPQQVHDTEYSDDQTLAVVADTLVRCSYFTQALQVYHMIEDNYVYNEIRIKIVYCLYELSKYQEALDLLNSIEHGSGNKHYYKGLVCLEKKDLTTAEYHFRKALEIFINESTAEVLYNYYGVSRQRKSAVELTYMTPVEILCLVQRGPTADIAKCVGAMGVLYRRTSNLRSYEQYASVYSELLNYLYGSASLVQPMVNALINSGVRHAENDQPTLSIDCYVNALKMFQQLYGTESDHKSIALALKGMALNYKALGENVKARDLYIQSLEMYRKVYRTEYHPDVANILFSLGLLLSDMHDYEKAGLAYLKTLMVHRNLHGEVTAVGHKTIPLFHNMVCDFGELPHGETNLYQWHSRTAYCRCYAVVDSTDVATVLNCLGFNSYLMQDHKLSKIFSKDALDMYKRVSDKNSSILRLVAHTQKNRGRNFSDMGKHAEASKCFFDCLLTYQDIHGVDTDHYDTASVLMYMGMNFLDQREVNNAGLYIQSSLDMHRKLGPGEHHLDKVKCRFLKGNILDMQRRYDEAENIYREALQEAYHIHGGNDAKHVDVAGVLYYLGRNLHYQMRYDEAGLILEVSLDMFKEVIGTFDKHNVGLLHMMGKNFAAQQKYVEAHDYLHKASTEMSRIYGFHGGHDGNQNEELAHLERDIGLNHYHRQQYTDAELRLKECLKIYKHLPPTNGELDSNGRQQDIASALLGLFFVYSDKADVPQSMETAKQALDIYKKVDPENESVPILVAFLDRVEI